MPVGYVCEFMGFKRKYGLKTCDCPGLQCHLKLSSLPSVNSSRVFGTRSYSSDA